MAILKEKNQRNFRISSGGSTSLEFNKIKVGKSTISGDVTTYIPDYLKGKTLGGHFKYDKETVEKAIDSNDIEKMRLISDYFYRKSGIYQRLCHYMAYLYRYDWIITPQRNDSKINDNKVIEGWTKASIYLENCQLKHNFGKYALATIKNGCYYGYKLDQGAATYLQKLPVNYCRSRYELNGKAAVEFNIRFFDDSFSDNTYKLKVLKSFPKEFQKAYISYKQGNLVKDFAGDELGWFLLDPDRTVKFSVCDSDAPLFISVIPAILDLEYAKKLDRDKMAQQLLKIIIQKMPIDKNGDLIFDVQEANMLHNNAVQMIGNAIGIDVLTTFADVDVADMSDKSNVTTSDWLERMERSVFNEVGSSEKLFNTDGQTALDKSIANDEALMVDLMYQFAAYAEELLGPYNKNPKRLRYRVSLLPTTIYNYKDLAKMYKEQVQLGFSKLLPQVALGMTQSEVIATAIFENQMLSLNDLFVPPQMSSTMSNGNKATSTSTTDSGESKSDTGGRPTLPDDQKSEKTLRNIESNG